MRINTTLSLKTDVANGNERNALADALGADKAEKVLQAISADAGKRVRVTLSDEQFSRLAIARRTHRVEPSLKWSKAEIVAEPQKPIDLAA